MRLRAGHHLAYSTNVHPGESWGETFDALEKYTLAVRAAIAPNEPFGIGLRLSDQASRELIEPRTLAGNAKHVETRAATATSLRLTAFLLGNSMATR